MPTVAAAPSNAAPTQASPDASPRAPSTLSEVIPWTDREVSVDPRSRLLRPPCQASTQRASKANARALTRGGASLETSVVTIDVLLLADRGVVQVAQGSLSASTPVSLDQREWRSAGDLRAPALYRDLAGDEVVRRMHHGVSSSRLLAESCSPCHRPDFGCVLPYRPWGPDYNSTPRAPDRQNPTKPTVTKA
jgi:hypothetical protein